MLVDATADLRARRRRSWSTSKAFDNSILCTNESVLIVEEAVADRFLARDGAGTVRTCSTPDERDRVRDTVFPDGRFDTALVGKDAATIADAAGVRVPAADPDPGRAVRPRRRRGAAGAREALPGARRDPGAERRAAASARAVAVLRIGGAGHSAVIHSNDPRTVMEYAAAVDVLRVTVNEGGSTGSAGFGTHLAPSMTIGTGFVGRSSLGENLEPKHLVNLDPDRLQHRPVRGRCRRSTGMVPWAGAGRARAAVPAWRAT